MSSWMTWKTAACLLLAAAIGSNVQAADPAPPPAAKKTDDDEEAAKKRAILESEQWHQVSLAFQEWLSVQNIYDAEQVAQLPTRFRERIAGMNSRELQTFLDQMQAKVGILLSPQAAEARDWLSRFVSARVIFSEEELNEFDIVHMTVAQLEGALRKVDARREARRRAQASHNRTRQAQVNRQLANNREKQQARNTRAAASRTARPPAQSQFAPRRDPPPESRPQFIVCPLGGLTRML